MDNTQNTPEQTKKARLFMSEIAVLAQKYQLPVFAVTQGASITRNTHTCEAVFEARRNHITWEKAHGYDPSESWEQYEG